MTDEHTEETAAGGPSRRTFLKSGALATGALAVGTGAVVSGTGGGDDAASVDSVQQDDDRFASVEFSNQESDGTTVTVDKSVFSELGYVAFHDESLFEGDVLGSVVGVSDRQEAGIGYQTDTDLFDVPGGEFDRDRLEGSTPLVAMPHSETGDDETYDFVSSGGEEDGPIAEEGLPVVDLAFVNATGGGDGTATDTPTESDAVTQTETDAMTQTETDTVTPAGTETETETPAGTGTPTGEAEAEPFAAIDFENQTLDDDAVIVGEVVLSEGGFVAMHDAGLFEGDALGSVVGVSDYLEAGRHRSVEVTLDDPDQIAEVDFPPAPTYPLVPMPHRDTDGNETYDFVTSEGEEDGPYTKAGQAVVDLGFVVTESEGTATEVGAETETYRRR